MKLARDGMLTRAHKATKEHLGERMLTNDVDPVLVNVLCDAQTSGGLLISVSEDQVDALVASLKRHDAPCSAVIGTVTSRDQHAIHLL